MPWETLPFQRHSDCSTISISHSFYTISQTKVACQTSRNLSTRFKDAIASTPLKFNDVIATVTSQPPNFRQSSLTMPPTRRSSRNAAAKGLGRQSTLSFNNKVSKAGATKLSAKEAAAAAAAVTSPSPASPAAERKESAEEAELIEAPVSAQVDEVDIEEEEQSGVQKLEKAPAAKLKSSPAEARAEKVTDAQIKKYWRDVEAARIAKRVHQEELSLAEKVLRYFDISSQYGVRSHTSAVRLSAHDIHC